jgi:hypothetical protein
MVTSARYFRIGFVAVRRNPKTTKAFYLSDKLHIVQEIKLPNGTRLPYQNNYEYIASKNIKQFKIASLN